MDTISTRELSLKMKQILQVASQFNCLCLCYLLDVEVKFSEVVVNEYSLGLAIPEFDFWEYWS